MKHRKPNSKRSLGMSIIETLVVVSAVGVMAAVSVPAIVDVRSSARESKLRSEMATLNNAMKSYIASGGKIEEDDDTLEVLDLLKAEIAAADLSSHVGYTGSYVDPRLTGKPIDKYAEGKRVAWDYAQGKFVITTEFVAGISEFELDENAQRSGKKRESHSLFKYASDDNDEWVWKYGSAPEKQVFVPTVVATNPGSETPTDPILIALVPVVDQTPPDYSDPNPDPEDPNRLDAPTFSIGGGTLPLANYLLDLMIENPNAGTESAVIYRLGGRRWKIYDEGDIIALPPESTIDAYVHSFSPGEYTSSTLATSNYGSNPVQLDLSVDADSNSVGYFDLVNSDVSVRWNVTNLNAFPDYLKNGGLFASYYTTDSSDPSFPANRILGQNYTPNYVGESLQLTPNMWGTEDTLGLSFYAESLDTTWVHHSEKPSVTISARKDALSPPAIELEQIQPGVFSVTLTPTGEMPPGAAIYYNATGETMAFDETTGHVAEGTVYSGPFTWEPETEEEQGNGEGATGTVNIDRGNGDVPITQVILRTNGNDVTQNGTVAFDAMEHPGADTMRGATVNDNSNAEVTIESITINDNGNIIVADNVNVLDLTVTNMNYPTHHNLDRVTAYENGVKLGDANDGDFGQHLENMLSSRDLRDYIKYDGNTNLLHSTPYDFDVIFSPLSNNDYLVVAERFGNSTFDLEPLDASGNVIDGSNKVVIREYSWNTGYAPSDMGGQPMFLAVVDIEKFGVDTDLNSITGFRVNDDGGADIKFFTISDTSFENRPVNFAGDLTAAAYPPANLVTWFSPSSAATSVTEGEIPPEDPNDPGSGHSNNGHGNNADGVDSSNPGQGNGGPNGAEDESGDVDDETGPGNGGNNNNGGGKGKGKG